MGSVSFPAFALTLLHFPCPAHEPPPNTGTPTCADGLRSYTLAFVAVCFLPHGLKPSGSVIRNRETQRFGFFKARWLQEGSRKLDACWKKTEAASFRTPS